MAGDWIKMRAALCTHPKVLMIADIVGSSTEIGRRLSTGFSGSLDEIVTSDVTRDVTLAALLRVWCATNEHTDDGVWRNSNLRTLDHAAGIPGFGEAMAAAGWAIYDSAAGTVTLPNFLENNAPAKNNARSTGAERQARYRAKKSQRDVTPSVTCGVTMSVTSDAREEKRREEEKRKEKEPAAPAPTPPLTADDLLAEGISREATADWFAVRKRKKGGLLTPLAWSGFKAEVAKAGWGLEAAVLKCIQRNWISFEAEWVAKDSAGETAYQRSQREKVQAHMPAIAARPPGAPVAQNAMEYFDAQIALSR